MTGREMLKVFVFGRMRGLTSGRVAGLLARSGSIAVSSLKAADKIVLTHSRVEKAVDATGSLLAPFDRAAGRLWSEGSFRAHLGLCGPAAKNGAYSAEHVSSVSGLSVEAVHALRLFDVAGATDGLFSFSDVALARRVCQWQKSVPLPSLISALHQLGTEDTPLSRIELAPLGGGQLGAVVGGKLSRLGGQFEMPLGDDAASPLALFEAAENAEASGELEEAARLYSLAARLDRRDAVIPFNLGNVLDELERLAEAAVQYQLALKLDPNFSEAWYNLGVLWAKRGDRLQAKACYRRAAACEPAAQDATFNLARLLCEEGSYGEGLPLWEHLANDPSCADRGEARKWATICRMEMMKAGKRT